MAAQCATDLAPLMSVVAGEFQFTDAKYPGRRRCTNDDERFVHDVSHSHKHLSKAVGEIGAQVERADHGYLMDEIALRDRVASLANSVLNLANVLRMPAEELVERMLKQLEGNPANKKPKRDKSDRL